MTPVISPKPAIAIRAAQSGASASLIGPEPPPSPQAQPIPKSNPFSGRKLPDGYVLPSRPSCVEPPHGSFSASPLAANQSRVFGNTSARALLPIHKPEAAGSVIKPSKKQLNRRPLKTNGPLPSAKHSLAALAARNESASSPVLAESGLSSPSGPQFEGRDFLVANGYSDFKRCGAGKYATVYTAKFDENTVCVKVNDSEAITDEFKAMEACSSPRLCKPILHNVEQAPRVLVMEFSDGVVLEDESAKVKFRSASPEQQLQWVKKAVLALNQLHSSNYTHNDISAGNILLTDTGDGDIDLKIIDFGKASSLDQRSHLGTPIFISPRAMTTSYKNRGTEIRIQNDLYAFGVCLATFYVNWQDIKVGGQKMSEFGNFPVKLKTAYKNNQVVNVGNMGIPPHLKEIVDKLLSLSTFENVGTVTTMVDQFIERGRMAASDRR